MKNRFFSCLVLVCFLLSSCRYQKTLPPPSIMIHRKPGNMHMYVTYIPSYDPNSTNPFQVDLRSADLTKLDLSTHLVDLMKSDFDSKTKWPSVEKMPTGFDPTKILEVGKDPGLGMRYLHETGITGRGVGIAIVDQFLIADHVEYKNQLQFYEEDAEVPEDAWSMHGPAVASIAVGKNVGVAPEADLYFIGSDFCPVGGKTDFSCLAKNVRRIIEINKTLPLDRKIRVLSMSIGWTKGNLGYDEITQAVNEAKAAGIFVVSSSLQETYGFAFQGLGRSALSDPNDFQAYGPGAFWKNDYYQHNGDFRLPTLLLPMDARAIASPTGYEDYAFYADGGWSWSIPYIAGMYALACQVKPSIVPEEFWSLALKTGKTITLIHAGKTYSFGIILDPQALIAALEK